MTRVPTMTLPPPTAMSKSAPAARAARSPLLYGWPGGIFVHGIEDTGIQRAELGLDAFQQIGLMRHGLATDNEGPLGLVTTDFISQVAEGIHTSIQAPGIADGAKGMGGQEVHRRSFLMSAGRVGSFVLQCT